MANIEERYLVDDNGNRIGVVLGVKEYGRLLQDLEELESIRAYDVAKASGEEVVPFKQVITEIESHSVY
jgi:hypothetical protein